MRNRLLVIMSLVALAGIGYAAPAQKSLESSLNSIENQYNELLRKEAQQKTAYEQEKAKLESEVEELKTKLVGKEELEAKLKRDSEVRWHRDEYKKILKNYDEYYKNLEKTISQKEQRIADLDVLLSVM